MEILFRGKRVDNGEWVFGYFGEHWSHNTEEHYFHISRTEEDNGRYTEEYAVIPETIGQYTGLDDKNDVEIYDGDIVKAWIDLGPAGETLAIYVVEITPFGCTLQDWTYECEGFLPEIIGNIHDNPELLEEVK